MTTARRTYIHTEYWTKSQISKAFLILASIFVKNLQNWSQGLLGPRQDW
jgi:hypothetical protein